MLFFFFQSLQVGSLGLVQQLCKVNVLGCCFLSGLLPIVGPLSTRSAHDLIDGYCSYNHLVSLWKERGKKEWGGAKLCVPADSDPFDGFVQKRYPMTLTAISFARTVT